MDSTEKKQEEQLPRELIEEILSRVYPNSLARFRVVCKLWNSILSDKMFINNHKETFRFILKTESNIYSVSIDPKIVVRVLTLDIPGGLESQKAKTLVDCGEFLICGMDKGATVCNPWLKQSLWISHPSFLCCGIGYDSDRRTEGRVYKTIWFSTDWNIHDFSSITWKDVTKSGDSNQGEKLSIKLHSQSGVSLNGVLFWIAFTDKTDPLYGLINFNNSSEVYYIFCDLPCGVSSRRDALVLRVFEGDRFSVLKQCHITKKIEIWVTKNKVNVKNGNDVIWLNFMTLSIPMLDSGLLWVSNSKPIGNE